MKQEPERAALGVDTPRLRIRELCAGDERLYCDLYTNPQVMRFIAPPMTARQAARSFRAALASACRRPPEHVFLAVIEKTSREAIGICCIQHFDMRRRRAEAGIILRPEAQARGYAKEAFGALLDRAFAAFAVDQIQVQFSVDHSAARRVIASLGLSPCDEVTAGDRYRLEVWSAHRNWRRPGFASL